MSQSRLIDAVLNRACEGMRTLEDIARFVHDDAETSDSLKTLRHEVRDLAATHWSRDDMIRSRDVGGDVGADQPRPHRRALEVHQQPLPPGEMCSRYNTPQKEHHQAFNR